MNVNKLKLSTTQTKIEIEKKENEGCLSNKPYVAEGKKNSIRVRMCIMPNLSIKYQDSMAEWMRR